jgi:hypothetical protein
VGSSIVHWDHYRSDGPYMILYEWTCGTSTGWIDVDGFVPAKILIWGKYTEPSFTLDEGS